MCNPNAFFFSFFFFLLLLLGRGVLQQNTHLSEIQTLVKGKK